VKHARVERPLSPAGQLRVLALLPYARVLARSYARFAPWLTDDLYQASFLGVCRALAGDDGRQGPGLLAYVRLHCLSAMRRVLRLRLLLSAPPGHRESIPWESTHEAVVWVTDPTSAEHRDVLGELEHEEDIRRLVLAIDCLGRDQRRVLECRRGMRRSLRLSRTERGRCLTGWETAKYLGLSPRRVPMIEAAAMERLRTVMVG
jgi:DNA-directed RNA polymerase specialized sigma24 family protein